MTAVNPWGAHMIRSAKTRRASIDKMIAKRREEIAELEAAKQQLQAIIDSEPAAKEAKAQPTADAAPPVQLTQQQVA